MYLFSFYKNVIHVKDKSIVFNRYIINHDQTTKYDTFHSVIEFNFESVLDNKYKYQNSVAIEIIYIPYTKSIFKKISLDIGGKIKIDEDKATKRKIFR